MKFYLGTHLPHWLGTYSVPLFVSRRRLERRKSLPRARGPWALDSGGFTVLNKAGKWDITPAQYVAQVERYSQEIGNLEWAASMDWMCEPKVREKTKKRVEEHQELTVRNYLELRQLAPDRKFLPVLQGWEPDDYLRCVDLYLGEGVDLFDGRLVGLGSVCRRQHTSMVEQLLERLQPMRLHGFGIKTAGLQTGAHNLASSDSMAWSLAARRKAPIQGHTHMNCANCPVFALRWRERVLEVIAGNSVRPRQLGLWDGRAWAGVSVGVAA